MSVTAKNSDFFQEIAVLQGTDVIPCPRIATDAALRVQASRQRNHPAPGPSSSICARPKPLGEAKSHRTNRQFPGRSSAPTCPVNRSRIRHGRESVCLGGATQSTRHRPYPIWAICHSGVFWWTRKVTRCLGIHFFKHSGFGPDAYFYQQTIGIGAPVVMKRPSHSPVPLMTMLLVSPLQSDHVALRRILSRSVWRLHCASHRAEAATLMGREAFSVVICVSDSQDSTWKRLLAEAARTPDGPRLVVSSRYADNHLWAEVLQAGAYDFLPMPWEAREVLRLISLAWQSWARGQRSGNHSSQITAVPSLGKCAVTACSVTS